MISRLRDLVKSARTRHDALENIHIELQNLKIQLIDKGYEIITSPGAPGPSFDEDLASRQIIKPEDKELVDYYETVRRLKEAVDSLHSGNTEDFSGPLEKEFISLVESKPH